MSIERRRQNRRNNLSYYVLVAAFLTFLAFLFPMEWVLGDDVESLDYVLAVAWLSFPVAGYLDVRRISGMDDVDWTPKAWLWTLAFAVPIFNVSASVPYLLRRYERVGRRESWSSWWRIAVAGAAGLFLVLVASVAVEDHVYPDSAAVEYVFTELIAGALLFSTVLTPAAVKYDVEYVRENYGWNPDGSLWIAGAAIWFVNIFVLLGYAAKRSPDSEYSRIDDEQDRWSTSEDTVERGTWNDPETRASADTSDATTGTPAEVDSRWWYWPAATVALSLVFAAVAGYVVHGYVTDDPSVYGLAFQLVNLLLLLAFVSLVSLYAIYRDARAIAKTDDNWQPFWQGYIIAGAFVSPIASSLVYLVQRHRHLGTP